METQYSLASTKKASKKSLTCTQAEEQHLLSISKSSKTMSSAIYTEKNHEKNVINLSSAKSEHQSEITNALTTSAKRECAKLAQNNESNEIEEQQVDINYNGDHTNEEKCDNSKKNNVCKKKSKAKKNKKAETDKQNISVKSSFSKFDAIQKRNLIHVRSIDASTAQEKFSNPQGEEQQNCRLCENTVYKMEEIKAEKNIYHKSCFRCKECNKQLKVDTYHSHEGILYCTVHIKLLFAPKSVEGNETAHLGKPELIIRENQPTELPPDVVRASDKPDLGLEELHQLNIRSKFQAFEQGKVNNNHDNVQQMDVQKNNVVRRSSTIISKVAKLQQLNNAKRQQDLNASTHSDDDYGDEIDYHSSSDNPNADFIRRKKNEQKRELPVGIGEAMNDIRTLFENGHGAKKEERREERKQEIQNIRSRLFMGKQARIKEMYQQAIADSANASERKPNIDIGIDSKSLRERFENGEVFRESNVDDYDGEISRNLAIEKEAAVFESAISKKSRSIFMELDANVIGKNLSILPSSANNKRLQHQKAVANVNNELKSELENDVIKCCEALEDVKIETSEISKKFKFFEKYHPTENEKRVFSITPPREGVVKMPSEEETSNENLKEHSPNRNIIELSRTTSIMLNKFRQLEKNPNRYDGNNPKPLKCFTPPPDDNRRFYTEKESDEYDSNDDEEDESNVEDSGDDNYMHLSKDDEGLKEAQNAARAKQLRIKFEKWQANEIKRERIDEIFRNRNDMSDENSIESTQSIRDRFEKMKNDEKIQQKTRPRYQVNRFV